MLEAARQGERDMMLEQLMMTRNRGFSPTQVQIPVTLWHGQEDRHVPLHMAQAIERQHGTCTTKGHTWRRSLPHLPLLGGDYRRSVGNAESGITALQPLCSISRHRQAGSDKTNVPDVMTRRGREFIRGYCSPVFSR